MTDDEQRVFGRQRHSSLVRLHAVRLFEKGLGYKATARMLGIAPATVRDWLRLWKKGLFVVAIQAVEPELFGNGYENRDDGL